MKRRLEQYEHDRQVERAHANRIQAKREADIEARLRKDRVCLLFPSLFDRDCFIQLGS